MVGLLFLVALGVAAIALAVVVLRNLPAGKPPSADGSVMITDTSPGGAAQESCHGGHAPVEGGCSHVSMDVGAHH